MKTLLGVQRKLNAASTDPDLDLDLTWREASLADPSSTAAAAAAYSSALRLSRSSASLCSSRRAASDSRRLACRRVFQTTGQMIPSKIVWINSKASTKHLGHKIHCHLYSHKDSELL